MKARDYIPALKFGGRLYPEDFASPLTFSGQYLYVDGDHGTDSDNAGTTIEKPFLTIQKAIDSASAWDVIFIAAIDPDSDASEPGTYAEDLTIAYAKHGLSLIGVTPGRSKMPFIGPKIKNATAVPLIDVLAAGVHLENIQLNCTRNSGTYGVYLEGNSGYTTAAGSVGFTMANCMIKNGGRTGAYGGVHMIGGYGSVISDCTFDGCLYGLILGNSVLPSNGHTVEYCNLKDINAEAATAHITVPPGLNADINIDHCNFAAATKFIVVGVTTSGVISFCGFNDGINAITAKSDGKIEIPAANDAWGVCACYDGKGALIVADGA